MPIPNNMSGLLWILDTVLTFNTSKWRDHGSLNYWVVVTVIDKKSKFAHYISCKFSEMYVRSPETKLVWLKKLFIISGKCSLQSATIVTKIWKIVHFNSMFALKQFSPIQNIPFFLQEIGSICLPSCPIWVTAFQIFTSIFAKTSLIRKLHNLIKQSANSIGNPWLINGIKDKL